MEKRRTIAVFDFDGTLTTKDTLLEFIKFACGKKAFYIGFLLHSPLLIWMKLGIYPNWKAKQKVFSWFFKGMPYTTFTKHGEDFAKGIKTIIKETTLAILRKHQSEGADIYVISASVDEWVRPFCMQLGVKDVIATQIETDSKGILTGRFTSPNCYGEEKVRRFLEIEPSRSEYNLYAYGDSRGDKEMILFADNGFYV